MRELVYVVLGMHRGGTSAIARGLTALGVHLGDRLLPPDQGNNDRGFWEDVDVIRLNDQLLDVLDATWHSLTILDKPIVESTPFRHLLRQGEELLRRKVTALSPYGFKDPRSSRLLFYWQEVFRMADLDCRFIIALRNPLSVALSLAKRDQFPAEKAHALWLQHMLAALRGTEGQQRVVVDYDRLIVDPIVQLERVRQALQMPPADHGQLKAYAGEFLSDELRHSHFDDGDVRRDGQVPRLAMRLYKLLEGVARDELSSSSETVRRDIRKLWDGMLDLAPTFALAEKEHRSVLELRTAVGNRDVQIEQLANGMAERDGHIAEYAKIVADREARIHHMVAAVTGRDEHIAERDRQIAEFARVLSAREDRLQELTAGVAERDGQIAEYAKIVTDREARIHHVVAAVTGRDEHIAERDRQIAEFVRVLSAREDRLQELTAGVAERDGQIAEYAKIVADREARIQHREEQVRALGEELSERGREASDLTARLAEQAETGKRLEDEMAALRASLAGERTDIEKLRSRLDSVGRQMHSAAIKLQYIEGSSFWRMTPILRHAWRFVENRILGRDFMFDLIPNKDLEVLREDYEWRAVGFDPYFQMISLDGRYPFGWVMIRSWLQRHSADRNLILYYDAGEGMAEATAIPLSVNDDNRVEELVYFPRGIRALRWDPMQWTGEFTQAAVFISRAGLFARWLHRIARIRETMRQHDEAKLREAGVNWRAFFSEPQRTYRVASELRNFKTDETYHAWITEHRLTGDDRAAIRRHIARFAARPLISVLMPVYNTAPDMLRAAIESVRAQLYENWELCIADDASTATHVREILEEYRKQDSRIKIEHRAVNGHISAASNTGLAMTQGEFIALLDHDDMLSEQALYQVAAELDAQPDTDIIYSDEDKIDDKGERRDPHFKPDWNPDLLYSQNYVSHLGVYRTPLIRAAGGFREGFEGSQDYDLLLRCLAAKTSPRVRHIPAILYHWRATSGSTALSGEHKSYATQSGVRALEDFFRSCNVEGVSVEPGRYPTTYRVRYPVPACPPKVSLIIPTRDGHGILRTCIDSIRDKTTYQNYEIVVVDNQSTDQQTLAYFNELRATGIRVLSYEHPFNYPAINNFAVEHVDGEIIGLINNDIEVISPEWLTEMVSHVLRPGIGAVGAKLYYSNDTIQHGGIILGVGGVAGHSHKRRPRGEPGYFGRLCLTQNLSAVTGACLLVRRETYLKVGGMDGANLTIAFNDVDFCLRLCEIGLRNVWTPHAELYHHESLSRGPEDSPEKVKRFQGEVHYMIERWGDRLRRDPFYNPMLSLNHEDFRPSFGAAPPKPWMDPRSNNSSLQPGSGRRPI